MTQASRGRGQSGGLDSGGLNHMNGRRATYISGILLFSSAAVMGCSAEDSSGGPVTLTIIEYQESRADAVEKLLPDFEAAMRDQGKDVNVKLIREVLPDEEFRTKITQQYNAGQAPDVADFGATYVPGLAGAGYLLDLTPYLDKWEGWDSFYPIVREGIVQPDGKIYQLPHEASTQALFYRKDVLEKLGISTEQPESWPDLITRLQEITAKTGEPSIVLPAGTAWGGGTLNEGFVNVMLGTGSDLYNEETKKWVVKSEGLTKAFGVYADLAEKDLLPTEALLNPEPWEPTKYRAFPEGTLPVAAQGTWGWRYDWGPEGAAPIPDVFDKVEIWDYPSFEGDPYQVSSTGFGYAISAETEHPDEAVELAEWLSSGEAMAEQLVAVGAAAPRSGIDDQAPYSEHAYLIDAEKALSDAENFPARPGQDEIGQAVGEATELILTEGATADEAADLFAERAEEILGPDQVESAD